MSGMCKCGTCQKVHKDGEYQNHNFVPIPDTFTDEQVEEMAGTLELEAMDSCDDRGIIWNRVARFVLSEIQKARDDERSQINIEWARTRKVNFELAEQLQSERERGDGLEAALKEIQKHHSVPHEVRGYVGTSIICKEALEKYGRK